MNNGLALTDYIILAGFFAVMLGIGIAYARRMKNLSDFFSGGGQVPWWLAGISLYMTTFSAFTFVSYSALAYQYGFVAVSIWWFSIPGCLLSAWFLAARWRRAATTSPVEYLETRYNATIRQGFSWFGVPLIVADDALKLFVIGTMITASAGMTSNEAKTWAIIGCGAIMLVYTLLGGLWAVMITDFIQFIVMAVAVLVLVPLAAAAAGGVLSVLERLPEGYGNVTNATYTWPWLLSFSVILALTFATKWPYVQRYYAARSDAEARKVGYTVAVLTVIAPPLLFWPAIAATQFLPDVADANEIYPMICRMLLPVGLMGVVLAAMFSATMSMLSSDYNAVASVITNDIIKRLFARNASDRALLLIGRLSTVLVGGLAMILAVALVYAQELDELVNIMAQLFAVLLPPVALPMAAGLLSNRVSGRGAIAGFAAGALLGIGAYAISYPAVQSAFAALPGLAWLAPGEDASLAWLRGVQWLTWITILPTAAGLAIGSRIWPDSPARRAEVDAFLDGLTAAETPGAGQGRPRDGLYALYIIGMTCALLGGLMAAAVLATAPLADAWLTLLVGLLLGAGGALAAWRGKLGMQRLGEGIEPPPADPVP
ncbi:MAG: sodium transporter [Candidatus Hydrogenedentes bacterium]|nr:sodium transporter [Candidatus Hydrogenedentota bacterium]